MVLAKDFLSEETLSVLRDKFSPSFGVDDANLRPTLNVFNKLKKKLPDDTYRQVLGLLLQYNTSNATENLYHNILVENRLLHTLRVFEGLRFELLDVLHDTKKEGDHVLNVPQTNRRVNESMNDEGVREGDVQIDNEKPMQSSSSDADDKALQLLDGIKEQTSLEFGLSRRLYQKIPTSLHYLNVEDSPASDEEIISFSGEPNNEVLIGEHLDAPTETLGDYDRSEKSGTISTKMAFSKRGSSMSNTRNRDITDKEGALDGRIEMEGDKLCSAGESLAKRREREVVSRSRKRARRLGAREDDMMLKQVGSHCIVIGVKDHAGTTDSSDYNTQSETDTMGSEPMTSQDDDEEGALVIVEEKQPSSSKPKKLKRSRSGKSTASLVKVSALCRRAPMIGKCEKRNSEGKRLKGDGPLVVLDKVISVKSSQNDNLNNSCSASEFSDEDVLNTHLEVQTRSEGKSLRRMARCALDDERTVLDILSSAGSEDYRSEEQTSTLSAQQSKQLTQGNRRHPYLDRSASITPFTNYLGLRPSGLEGNLSFPTRYDTNYLLKSDKRASRSVYSSAKSRPGSLVKRSHSTSTCAKYDPNFPFSTAAFSALSTIAEATSFEGSDYLHSQESSQDDILEYSECDTASSQDSCWERERAYGLGTFAQDDADDISFLNRLLRSPSPPSFGRNDGVCGKKRRHRHKPKTERKPRKPRRSRRLRGKKSREGDGDINDTITNNAIKPVTGKACTCCS